VVRVPIRRMGDGSMRRQWEHCQGDRKVDEGDG
jgi:hypothetical protein